ncbi:MAG TPA: peptide deformylase, partial [Rhabdochlamydiaceae bacterium]|nr:peptide deformylase [Rhabdochlamydiaceae bacterium]
VCDLEKLDIVQVGHPVLRQTARELSVEEIKDLIAKMKATMRAAPGVGLAAPQIGRSLQIVVIEDMDHRHLTPEQLATRNRHPVPFHVIINPQLYIDKVQLRTLTTTENYIKLHKDKSVHEVQISLSAQ